MKVKMIMLLFQILAISTLKSYSARIPEKLHPMHVHCQGNHLCLKAENTVNVAVRGRATQSDLFKGEWAPFSLASYANDGNRDSYFAHGSCTHTSAKTNPWWRVDLLQVYTITSVTITNRGDCCGERINGARILIGNCLENNGINNTQCSMIDSMATGETKTFYCQQPMTGRYVTVYIPREEFLTLCEVEVNAQLPAN